MLSKILAFKPTLSDKQTSCPSKIYHRKAGAIH